MIELEGQYTHPNRPYRYDATALREGLTAFENGQTDRDNPYGQDATPADEEQANHLACSWIEGFERGKRKALTMDVRRISRWINQHGHYIAAINAPALANMVTLAPGYDRTQPQPITIGSVSFTIPAPSTLD